MPAADQPLVFLLVGYINLNENRYIIDMDQESIEDLVKVFQSLGEEKQDEIINKVAKKDKAASKFLKRIQRMEKRGEKINNIRDKIKDKFSDGS